MKILSRITFTLLALSFVSSAEVLQNGDFSKGVKYWNINRHQHYGFETQATVTNGELELSDLRDTKQGYLNITQPIKIEYGKTYRVSFEAKGTEKQKFGCSIGDHKFADSASGKANIFKGSDWETFTFELTAKCETDSKWFKKSYSNAAKSTLNDKGVTTGVEAKKRADRPKEAGATVFAFGIGAIKGQIAFRNISILEVK